MSSTEESLLGAPHLANQRVRPPTDVETPCRTSGDTEPVVIPRYGGLVGPHQPDRPAFERRGPCAARRLYLLGLPQDQRMVLRTGLTALPEFRDDGVHIDAPADSPGVFGLQSELFVIGAP
ncbi:hypothetical protein [Streptomyces sp. NPDC051572]|uniref:hypothetical protein n=1 Tax=unclassified Streptomyces TaxID=2593676 RepID=UPI00344F5056